ncbi:hypothetical protein ACHAXR_003563, partial [Thalassiosira sp. AJA248-18]
MLPQHLYTPEAAKAISEQIMQAADVSHTMQHFSTFVKWNAHLYHEVLAAFQCGRTVQHQEMKQQSSGSNNKVEETIRHPKENWYESQIGFFDHYVIPLAERLDACGAFCAEEPKFAPFAVRNKEQWIEEGRECTRIMVNEAEEMELPNPMPITPVTGGDAIDDLLEKLTMSEMTGSTTHAGRLRQRGDESALDDTDADSTVAVPDEDAMSIPGSIDTSSRVSFVGSMASSKMSSSKWSRRSSLVEAGLCHEVEVDCSVNAIVPNIMVQQLVDSLQADVKSSPSDLQTMDALRGSILKYQSNGSIRRHRGALLFVDISGFTALSQNYPVEDFKTFINQYFTKIIDLVQKFGGQVVKFAGDALYAIWSMGELSDDVGSSAAAANGDEEVLHTVNIEKCTICAIAINAICNNYKVSKSYMRRRTSDLSDASAMLHDSRSQGDVMYNLQDKNAQYEERGSVLNVYCGVSEGIMAGVDVVASNRAEFFLVGKPLKDVAKAESLAGPGELIVSPSVYDSLRKKTIKSIASRLVFTEVESDFQRVSWPSHPTVDDMLLHFKNTDDITSKWKMGNTDAQSLIDKLIQNTQSTPKEVIGVSPADEDPDKLSLQSDLMRLLEYHRHEATRDVVGKFTAELRRVVVLFISIRYEPNLPQDPSEDNVMLENFQSIYSIICESISSRSGQVRQFINDDKGTVFIASFGLRRSVVLHPADTAVDAAKDAQKKLLEINIQCSIGITVGKIFCGETGSFQRYEYSLLGSPVNLSARLMAKGAWGQINCDEELKNHTGRRHNFTISGTYKLKGYEEP